jgi:hypothetical protein
MRALAASTLSSTWTTYGNGVMTEPIEGMWSTKTNSRSFDTPLFCLPTEQEVVQLTAFT